MFSPERIAVNGTKMIIKLATASALLIASHCLTVTAHAESSSGPLWEYVPETVSPAWGPFLREKSKGRKATLPAPDDLAAWKQAQVVQVQPLEAIADEIAETFKVAYEEDKIGGVPVLVVTPASLSSKEKIAVYTHGGAFVAHSAKSTLNSAALFAHGTGLRVISIDYTLAPHAKWPEIVDQVVAVFKALIEQGYSMEDIVLYGDSAGGSLAAGATLKMRDEGMGMPAALVLWSPWADISETGDTYVTLRDAEPFYTYADVLGPSALAYAEEADHIHPYVSPVYGDFSKGYPPTLIQGGTKEIFLSNFVRLYQAIDQAGQIAKLDIYEGMPHVHVPTMPDTLESKAAMKKVSAWVRNYLSKN